MRTVVLNSILQSYPLSAHLESQPFEIFEEIESRIQQSKNSNYLYAAAIQTRGIESKTDCSHCTNSGSGPFRNCISLPSDQKLNGIPPEVLFHCGNCLWQDSPCDLRALNPVIPDSIDSNVLLQDPLTRWCWEQIQKAASELQLKMPSDSASLETCVRVMPTLQRRMELREGVSETEFKAQAVKYALNLMAINIYLCGKELDIEDYCRVCASAKLKRGSARFVKCVIAWDDSVDFCCACCTWVS